ncbi:hypothetical protein F2P81_016544 [Scophthalmus maximus]|uniref:Uncharacterized protein n=1 Tax=Scophthalmus maximus TaxID=52904 RepID=A0A6A4SHK6_SCOMX|nr:hypothetical protein F2P81_016544 [Scophthalmus maximus]
MCGGRKPSLFCVKFNMIFHLFTFVLSAVSFGATVRHVPFQQQRYCSDCDWVSHEATLLLSGILSVLVTVLLVETLVSLVVIVTFLCFMSRDDPEVPHLLIYPATQ